MNTILLNMICFILNYNGLFNGSVENHFCYGIREKIRLLRSNLKTIRNQLLIINISRYVSIKFQLAQTLN